MKTKLKLLAGTTALVLASLAQAQAESMTVVSFGGAYGAAQKQHMIDPFVAETGNEILFEDYSGGIAEIKAQVEAGNVQWDVVDIETSGLCAEGYVKYDRRITHEYGLTDPFLARMQVPAHAGDRPGRYAGPGGRLLGRRQCGWIRPGNRRPGRATVGRCQSGGSSAADFPSLPDAAAAVPSARAYVRDKTRGGSPEAIA